MVGWFNEAQVELSFVSYMNENNVAYASKAILEKNER